MTDRVRRVFLRAAMPWLSLPMVALLALLVAAPATAQLPGLPAANAEEPAITGELDQLVKTLEDPQRRQQLVQDLKAILEAQRKTAEEARESAVGNNLGEAVATQTERVSAVFQRFVDWLGTFDQLPGWLAKQAEDPRRRAFWTEVGTVVGLTVLTVLLARWVAGLVLRRPITRMRAAEPATVQSRVFLAVTLALVEAFIVAVTIAAGYATLVLVSGRPPIEEGALVLVYAWAIQTGVGVVARFALAPHAEQLRLVPLRSETAAYLYVWTMRLTTVVAIGFVGARLAEPFGAGEVGARGIEIAAALLFTVLLIVLVLQSRDDFAAVLRGRHGAQVGQRLRGRLADIWHVLAALYVLVAFGIFVSGAQDGFLFLVKATVVTIVAFAMAVAVARLAHRLIERLFLVDDELNARFPGLRDRAGLYRPVLTRTIDVSLGLLAFGISVGAWGLDLYGAIGADGRARFLQSTVVVVLVIVIGVAIWEFASGAIQRSLSGTHPDGTPRQPSGRAKTLLPLLRRVIMIALVTFVGLIVLSEIGVDTAPLLAGAGVVGLAIGFGSQALVRDIITGLFILIEDTISVGDVVTAGGHTGVVEDISIRTLRLRDLEGSVHVVPFGDVTAVVNMTKDFSFALLDIGVAYREDTDHVSAIIREVGEELKLDPEHGPKILEPIEILGVDQLADSAVVIRARLKTKPILQWGIKREMNRRLKKRFDLEGIEIPFPHQTLYFGVDKDGTAPPGRILMQAERAAATLEHKAPEPTADVEPVRRDGVGGSQGLRPRRARGRQDLTQRTERSPCRRRPSRIAAHKPQGRPVHADPAVLRQPRRGPRHHLRRPCQGRRTRPQATGRRGSRLRRPPEGVRASGRRHPHAARDCRGQGVRGGRSRHRLAGDLQACAGAGVLRQRRQHAGARLAGSGAGWRADPRRRRCRGRRGRHQRRQLGQRRGGGGCRYPGRRPRRRPGLSGPLPYRRRRYAYGAAVGSRLALRLAGMTTGGGGALCVGPLSRRHPGAGRRRRYASGTHKPTCARLHHGRGGGWVRLALRLAGMTTGWGRRAVRRPCQTPSSSQGSGGLT